MKIREKNSKKMIFTALFIAVGIVLPFIKMQIPSIGNMLCPMHIPIILCGFICGGTWGFIAGLIVPILRSVLFGAPPLMPTAIAMSFELAAYGLITGIMYKKLYNKKGRIYISLITAMILGRSIWGIVSFGLYNLLGNNFTWKLFAMQAFINSIPGIVIQLTLIPIMIYKLQNAEGAVISYDK